MKKRVFLIVVLLAIGLAVQASAYTIGWGSNECFSGTKPTGSQPWTTTTFTNVSPGTVILNLATHGLLGTEYVSNWHLNFQSTYSGNNVENLSFTRTGGSHWSCLQ